MRKLLIACLNICLGIVCGLCLLELTLHANPALLLRGMGLPSPVDPPIEKMQYEVRYSDADIFYWQRDQVKPILPENDRVESQVSFETDEFGFPNSAPIPETVDVVVLGRSFSLGAQASMPWIKVMAEQAGLKILNLSQTGSGQGQKNAHMENFGYPRHPRWVVMEVLPSMDIIGYTTGSDLLFPALPEPIIRQFLRSELDENPSDSSDTAFYPLSVDIPGRTVDLTFYSFYLAALSVENASLEASNQWQNFKQA